MKKKETRGRKTKLTPELTERIKQFLAQGVDQKTACNLCSVPYATYNEWKAKGDKGIEPFREFFSITSRTRDQRKLRLIQVLDAAMIGQLPRTADWKAASWQLERGWPLEFASIYREQATPPAPEEKKKLSLAVFLNTGGKSLQEITNFPIIESPPPDEAKPPPADNKDAPQRVPQVIAGHCVGWRDRDELDADPEELP